MTDYRYAQPGDLIIDNSFTPPTEEQLRAGREQYGVVANMRYTSEPPTRNKNLTRAQAEMGWRVGVGALANQEQTHLDSLEGYSGGLRRARSFIATAEFIGYPKSVPAIVSVDTSWHPEALAFVRAFDFTLRTAGWEQVGTYFFGATPAEQLTNEGIGHDVLWQAHAGSYYVRRADAEAAATRLNAWVRKCPNKTGWEVISHYSHLFQEYGQVRLAGGPFPERTIDENFVQRPVRIWFPAHFPGGSRPPAPGTPPPIPTPVPIPTPTPDPQEDDMPTRYQHSDGAQYLLGPNGDDKVHISPAYADLLALDGSRLVGPSDEVDAKLAALVDGGSVRDVGGIVAMTVRDAQQVVQAQVLDEGANTRRTVVASAEETQNVIQATVREEGTRTVAATETAERNILHRLANMTPGVPTQPLKLIIEARTAGADD